MRKRGRKRKKEEVFKKLKGERKVGWRKHIVREVLFVTI